MKDLQVAVEPLHLKSLRVVRDVVTCFFPHENRYFRIGAI
jgi:hypothetical protein